MMNEKLKGHLFVFAAYILFAVNIPISKYLLPTHVTPEALTIMRMAFGCVMFWITSLFTAKEHVPLKDIGLLFVCGMFGIAVNQGLFINGLSLTSPLDASIITTGGPVFVMILAALILKEPITRMKAFGVLLGLCGALLLVLHSANVEAEQASSLGGNLMIVSSSLSYSLYLVLSRPLVARYSSVTIMKWMFLFATLALVPFTFQDVIDAPAFNREVLDYKELTAIFFVLFGATFLPYLFLPPAQKRIRPTTVSMYNYVQPIVASLIAILIGQDTLNFPVVVSAVFVFVGVYLVTQSKSRADVERELTVDD
ncbi:DMT family transporter [Parabacteroides sp. PF5-6]|uniref:DMT family transporter n=1 Tax=Parabacteroides sp. PF5-6 TaxID=1742403 RepID=UPI0024060994|nr:DMT family transporter [Parabacteroides sp. PF5-6]MDF9828929.1 drug/metabolite transporter (DMT)-like permease [Parabacteroides sp. PF5-6]